MNRRNFLGLAAAATVAATIKPVPLEPRGLGHLETILPRVWASLHSAEPEPHDEHEVKGGGYARIEAPGGDAAWAISHGHYFYAGPGLLFPVVTGGEWHIEYYGIRNELNGPLLLWGRLDVMHRLHLGDQFMICSIEGDLS